MSLSLIVSGLGAVVAAIGGGVLLARTFRAPRADLVWWSVALLGLLVSLGAQALGHLVGFDAAMFRAMEIGAQVVASLALLLALSEVAARSGPMRFCARLYIPALAIVALVVLLLDQLTDVAFTKAWPDPAAYYQIAPEYALYALGSITVVVAVAAMITVARRASAPEWGSVLTAELAGGAAALLLAYPALALLAANEAGVHLPVGTLFPVLGTVAAALIWLAGVRTGRVQLGRLRGGGRMNAAASDPDAFDEAGYLEPLTAGGPYRDGGGYGQERPAPSASGRYRQEPDDRERDWHDEGRARDWDDDWRPDSGQESSADWHSGEGPREWQDGDDGYQSDFATGDFAAVDYTTGAQDHGYPAGDWQADLPPGELAGDDRSPSGRSSAGRPDDRAGWAGREDDAARARLFGQIAIYTLLEDRVAEFDQLAERVVGQVRGREPDTLVYIVHAVPSAPMQRILYEVYRDRAAYQDHVRQPHVMQFEADRRPYVLATNVIELGLQQAKVSPFPSVEELFGEPGYDTSGFERPDYLRDYGRDTRAPQAGGSRERR
jgi:quinol monooxygenase YgiN